MWKKIFDFLCENWVDLSLIAVGLSAFIVYVLQERKKVSEAASLIVMQVEDLQKRISEIGSYIVNGELNATAFYESQPLFKTDYWDKYKHYFVRKMDAYSFNLFEEFYNCASEILEQQQLMKNLQKNSFFTTQQALTQIESSCIMKAMQEASDFNNILVSYNAEKSKIRAIINQNALTPYTPTQIRITLESALKKVGFISIIGCEGYKKLKKRAK